MQKTIFLPSVQVAIRNVVLAVGVSSIMALSAHVSVPFYPVPMTLQGAVVVLVGLVLGPRLALAGMTLYLAEGAFGLPVFAGTPERGIGLAYMIGPTGGFLMGFVLGSFLAGLMAARGWAKGLASAVFVALVAIFSIYLPGLLWLGAFTGYGPELFTAGLAPFVVGDIVKAVLATFVATGFHKLTNG